MMTLEFMLQLIKALHLQSKKLHTSNRLLESLPILEIFFLFLV